MNNIKQKISVYYSAIAKVLLAVVVPLLLMTPALVSAQAADTAMCGDVKLQPGQSCCAGAPTALLDCPGDDLWGLLALVINIMTGGVAIAAVAGVVYGAILYSSAGGSSDNIKKAKTVFTNVAIGVVMYLLAYAFLNYIIPGGILIPGASK